MIITGSLGFRDAELQLVPVSASREGAEQSVPANLRGYRKVQMMKTTRHLKMRAEHYRDFPSRNCSDCCLVVMQDSE